MASVDLLFRVYAALITLIPAVYMQHWTLPPNTEKFPVCRSAECKERGALYYNNMDPTADPCDDFYQFACGYWHITHPIPNYTSKWTIEDSLYLHALSDMRGILEKPVKTQESAVVLTAKSFYSLCMSRPYLEKSDAKTISAYISKAYHNAYMKPVWSMHDEFLSVSGESPFFGITYALDEREDYSPVIQFVEPGSAYGSMHHVPDWKAYEEEYYAQFLWELQTVVTPKSISPLNAGNVKDTISKVMHFRKELNKIAYKSAEEPGHDMEPMTIAKFTEWYKKIAYKNPSSQINWDNIIRILWPGLSDTDRKTRPVAMVRAKRYFIDLCMILSHTPEPIVAKHVELYFAERFLEYDESLKNKLHRVLQYQSYARPIVDVPRWIPCVDNHAMGFILAKIYLDNFLTKMDQIYTTRMTNDMARLLKHDVQASWMQPETKTHVIKTIDQLHTEIGFPSWYVPPFEKSQMGSTKPMKPKAYYDVGQNRIYIAAALFRPPIYQPTMPIAINIASMGFLIAHELYHVLGDCGTLRSINHEMVQVWWPDKDRRACERRKVCFIQEYNKYAHAEMQGMVENVQIDARRTFGEDVADVMGLYTAYNYFREKSKSVKDSCKVLPYFEDYSCEQLFFIAFANTLCGYSTQDYVSRNYVAMTTNLRRIRVNGAVKNHRAFQRAFGCNSRARMSQSRKCNLWD